MRSVSIVAIAYLMCACKFDALPPLQDDGGPADGGSADASVDGFSSDGATACVPNEITCDDATGRYVDCSSAGAIEVEMQCPLGCAPAAEKCLDMDPSNGVAQYLDMAATRTDAIDVIFSTAASAILADGAIVTSGAPQAVAFTRLADDTLVLMFKSLSVTAGTTLRIQGVYPVILVVDGAVTIDGTIEALAGAASPASLDCLAPRVMSGSSPTPGGGGGGFATVGAPGGASGAGVPGGLGGTAVNVDALVPLRGGCNGGEVVEGPVTALGGTGGGAIQIVSRTRITIRGNGAIDASGGGGGATGFTTIPAVSVGGPGGGSGGSILLEAPVIQLQGSAVLSTKGGSGAAAGRGEPGWEGQKGGLGLTPAAGGAVAGRASGGAGGTTGIGQTSGMAGATATEDGGGGGGSVGKARLNTLNGGGLTIDVTAAIRSGYTTGALRTRQIP